MSHARQKIREAFVSALSAISTPATESRILINSTLPAVTVYSTEEVAEPLTMGGISDRAVSIVVEARVNGSSIDDTLDALAVEIETGIATVSIVCVQYIGTEIEFDAETDNPYGIMRITYVAPYSTTAADPSTIRG